jgi:hypothetical protein
MWIGWWSVNCIANLDDGSEGLLGNNSIELDIIDLHPELGSRMDCKHQTSGTELRVMRKSVTNRENAADIEV